MKSYWIFIFLSCFCLLSVNAQLHDFTKYKAIIFDCDGVLVDTEALKYQAWHSTLKKSAVALEFSKEEYLLLVGLSSKDILKGIQNNHPNLLWNKIDSEKLIKDKDTLYYQIQARGVPLLSDAVKFLKQLIADRGGNGAKQKFKLGLASSAAKKKILENLKHMNVKESDFDVLLSGADDLKHIKDVTGVTKPKPYIYQEAAKKLKVLPSDCVVFEDTNAGIVAAADAGMDVVGTPNGYTEKHDFTRAIDKLNFVQISQLYDKK